MGHSKNFKGALHLEIANYCSGHGTTKNTPSELVEADLTASDRILSFSAGFPKPVKEDAWDVSANYNPSSTNSTHVSKGEGNLKSYLQTTNFFDIGIDGDLDEIPNSMDWRFTDGDGEKDIYGGLIEEHIIEGIIKQPVYQTMSWMSAQAKITGTTPIAGGGIPAYSAVSPIMTKDVSATIDSISSSNLIINLIRWTTQKVYADDDGYGIGSKYIQNPVLLEKKYILEVECIEQASNTWFADEMNDVPQLVSGNVVYGAVKTITFTNFTVKITNQGEIDAHGQIKRKYTFESGVGATVA